MSSDLSHILILKFSVCDFAEKQKIDKSSDLHIFGALIFTPFPYTLNDDLVFEGIFSPFLKHERIWMCLERQGNP